MNNKQIDEKKIMIIGASLLGFIILYLFIINPLINFNKQEKEMLEAAKNLEFERATELRDILFEMRSKK